MSKLHAVQFGVKPIGINQRFMVAHINDLPIFKRNNDIGVLDGG